MAQDNMADNMAKNMAHSTRHRVIQWSTGNVGTHALHGIITHPDLELAGLWVHSPTKAGRDAGELCGLPPTGVTASNDVDEVLALDADVVCYTATADLRPGEAVDDLCRILAAGKNVVSSSLVMLVHPPADQTGWAQKITAACEEGGVSCFTSGIDPGWANDILPLLLTGTCERVDSVRVQEVLNYATYNQPEVLFGTMGFGQPLDATPILLIPGALSMAWGGTVHAIADGLGVELEEVREVHERLPAPTTFSIKSGTVEEGTTAALRFEVQGIVDGEPRIVVEHVTRLRDDLAPDWPQHPHGGGYRVDITGSPSYRVDLSMEGPDGDENTGGLISTAMRLLNAIPAVVDAAPGMLGPLDLPLVTGRHVMPHGAGAGAEA